MTAQAGDRVLLTATVVRASGELLTLQLADGQSIRLGAEYAAPAAAPRPVGKQRGDGSSRLPD